MSAPETAIRAAFTARLLTLPSLPPVAWENVPYTPITGTTYLIPALLPGEPQQAEIGLNGANQHVGIYQVSVCAPVGGGVGASGALRDSIVDWFKRGTTMIANGVTVTVTKAYPGPALTDGGWIQTPITIRYRVFAAN